MLLLSSVSIGLTNHRTLDALQACLRGFISFLSQSELAHGLVKHAFRILCALCDVRPLPRARHALCLRAIAAHAPCLLLMGRRVAVCFFGNSSLGTLVAEAGACRLASSDAYLDV